MRNYGVENIKWAAIVPKCKFMYAVLFEACEVELG